jgi:glyoxylase-like metal-dependent hydrolase (beta-lactamase superfamily II)
VIIFQPSHKVLISADALWADGFGVVFPELEGKHAFDEVAKTLDLIEGLQAEWVIPGHGAIFQDVASALAAARRKLDGFMQNPEKHARYGAKVLLKFKLLELQRAPQASFVLWATQTHYFQVLHQRYGLGQPIKEWVEQLLADLQRSRALELVGHDVVNL